MERRHFIKKSSLGTAAAVAFPTIVPSSVFGKNAPSNKINIGQIGCGRIARDHDIRDTIRYDQTRFVGVCDVDSNRLLDAQQLISKYYKEKTGKDNYVNTKIYDDYREMLLNKDIDAVVISTPDHWHSQPAIEGGVGRERYLFAKAYFPNR